MRRFTFFLVVARLSGLPRSQFFTRWAKSTAP